jgi:hypothetical protein
MSTETTDTGNSSKTPEVCRRETEEHKLITAVEHGGAQIEQATTTLSRLAANAAIFLSCLHTQTGAEMGDPARHGIAPSSSCGQCTAVALRPQTRCERPAIKGQLSRFWLDVNWLCSHDGCRTLRHRLIALIEWGIRNGLLTTRKRFFVCFRGAQTAS